MRNLIQIAGVRDEAECALLVRSGVDLIGFPLRLPFGGEDLTEPDAARIISKLPASVKAVCITYLESARDVADLCAALGAAWVQLHGPFSVQEMLRLRELAPGLSIIKSLIVRGGNTDALFEELDRYNDLISAFITDTFDPQTGRCGATGLQHDWQISRKIVERSKRPVILAGGLRSENIRDAILTVRPAAVDAHTGVEDGVGAKDATRLAAFVREAREAFNQIDSFERSRNA